MNIKQLNDWTSRFAIFFLTFFSCIGLQAQQQFSFTLNQAIEYGLEHNLEVKNYDYDIKISKKKVWEAVALGLPQISGKVHYQYNLELAKTLIPNSFFDPTQSGFTEVAFGTEQNMNGDIVLDQLIFSGSYLVGISSARLYESIADLKNKVNKKDITKQIISSYCNILLVEETLKILRKNIAVLQKNIDDTKVIYQNGLTELEDLQQLELSFSQQNADYNNTKRLKAINYQIFAYLLNLEANASIEFTDTLDLILSSYNETPLLFDDSVDLSNNLDYKLAKVNVDSKKKLFLYEKSKSLPTLSASLNLNYTGFSDTFTFLESSQRWIPSSAIGLNLKIPIFSSFSRQSKVTQAKLEKFKAENDLVLASNKIQLQYYKALSDYLLAKEMYKTTKNNLQLAENIEEKNRIKYAEGIASSFEFKQAQNQLYGSQKQYLSSIIDVINKKVNLDFIINAD